jgi:hypothetical protein
MYIQCSLSQDAWLNHVNSGYAAFIVENSKGVLDLSSKLSPLRL